MQSIGDTGRVGEDSRAVRLNWRVIAVLVAAIGGIIAMFGLGATQRGDPPSFGRSFGDDIPATVYMPEEDPDEPLPVVVLAHGYSGDRVGLSTLGRWFARNGYAAVAFDVRGHGTNNSPFIGDIRDDLITVLDKIDDGGDFDPNRIALVGHSMGAFLVVEHASRDARIKATVALAGGDTADGPLRPANVLFLLPSSSDDVHSDGKDLAAKILGHDVTEGQTEGDFAAHTAVRVDTVKTGIATIITSPGAGERTIEWLDQALGVKRDGKPDLSQDRRAFLFMYIPFGLVLLYAAGSLIGRLAPSRTAEPATRVGGGLLLLTAALIAPWPITSFVVPAGFLRVDVAESLVSVLALAGVVLITAVPLLRRSPDHALARLLPPGSEQPSRVDRATWLAVGAGFLAMYLLVQPIGPFLHELVPTPKRLVLGVVISAGLAVFTIPLERWLRRGSLRQAVGISAAARVLLLVVLYVGAALGVVDGFILLIMPLFVVLFLVLEVFSAGVYAASRNVTVIALVNAATLGWVLGVFMPVRI